MIGGEPLDAPNFVTANDADGWLGAQERVIALELNGDTRAYHLQVLTWHDIANDVVGGVPNRLSQSSGSGYTMPFSA